MIDLSQGRKEEILMNSADKICTSKTCPVGGDNSKGIGYNIRNYGAVSTPYFGSVVWARFTHTGGLSNEAVKRNVDNLLPLILGTDESKLLVNDKITEPVNTKSECF